MRPPNPELVRLQEQVHRKLTLELNSLSQSLSLDAERLRAHQADLLLGEPAIKDEMARLEAVRDVCRNVANRTRQAIQQADSNITELKRKGDPEVDELVCATSIVHNQSVSFFNLLVLVQFSQSCIRLINLVADDNAIEDTIYHLHRALNTNRIDLERFLRVSGVPPNLYHTLTTHRNLVDPCASRGAIHETCLG
jgi:ESCRT-I complex subunit TSG101